MSRLVVLLVATYLFHMVVQAAKPVVKVASFMPAASTAALPPPLVNANAAILMDRQSGFVLWSHNPDLELPMASTTKIMTAMVILDHGASRLNEMVKVSRNAYFAGGNYYFHEGDVTTLDNLLIAALTSSSNQATVAAAEYLAGDEQTFVGWMNAKAHTLGLKHTRFLNPHGLFERYHGLNHHTTARELALITRAALSDYPLIREIIVMGPVKIAVQPYKWKIWLNNHDRIVNEPVPGVPGAVVDGVKTGYVTASGKCLVSSATLHNWQLIAVVLNCPMAFQDNLQLLRYGFTHYTWERYASATQPGASTKVLWGAPDSIPLGTARDFGVPVLKDGNPSGDEVMFVGKPLRAPIRKGAKVGKLELHRHGQLVNSTAAIALCAAPLVWWIHLLIAIGYLCTFLICLVVIDKLYGTHTKNTRRRRRVVEETGGKTYYGRTRDR